MPVVHLIDGTYELFQHFYGQRSFNGGNDKPHAGVVGVLGTVLKMLETGVTHIGVATDHVIESFRNDLWPGYKTGEGMDPVLWAQFHPLEDALRELGVATWPMVELEADDGLASAAHLAAADASVENIQIWTPDKDLAQMVMGTRVVQVDRRSGEVRDEAGVLAKFGVPPSRIPDFLALVGDSADGYPGVPKIGKKTAAVLIAKHGPLEAFPPEVLGEHREHALLFKRLATLRTDAQLFQNVDELLWRGPLAGFETLAKELGAPQLWERACKAAKSAIKTEASAAARAPKRSGSSKRA